MWEERGSTFGDFSCVETYPKYKPRVFEIPTKVSRTIDRYVYVRTPTIGTKRGAPGRTIGQMDGGKTRGHDVTEPFVIFELLEGYPP